MLHDDLSRPSVSSYDMPLRTFQLQVTGQIQTKVRMFFFKSLIQKNSGKCLAYEHRSRRTGWISALDYSMCVSAVVSS